MFKRQNIWPRPCFLFLIDSGSEAEQEVLLSLKGVYTALSGALAQSLKLDTIANNIANVNTTGFKKDTQTFQEYLTALEKEQGVIQVPKVPASIDSFYQTNGGDKSFVDAAGTFTNFEQGSLRSTGGKLDVAIDGAGFFEVSTPAGIKLTRAGNFTVDANGQLVTKDGYPVLLEAGESEDGTLAEDSENRIVKFSGQATMTISEAGEVLEGEKKIGKLSLVNVINPESLQKVGNNYFGFKENLNPEVVTLKNPSLKQGFLETSNVNIIQEMTDMIMAQRVFEGTQKAMSAYDNMADKLINQVGNTKG